MRTKTIFIALLILFILNGCIDLSYEESKIVCENAQSTEGDSLLSLYKSSSVTLIENDVFVEGYVISSSVQGQFYGELIIQDKNKDPNFGMRILTDATHIETIYPKGTRIRINLQGLYIQFREQSYTLGAALPSFGNIILGRIPTNELKSRLNRLCEPQVLEPTITSINELISRPLNSLVQLDSLRFKAADSLLTFSETDDETVRYLFDCNNDSIALKTSNYAVFATDILPGAMGSIQAAYKRNSSVNYLEISTLKDLNFDLVACEPAPFYVSSNQVLISEWADPSNNTKARFIELHNSSDVEVSLNGWRLVRYTNSNTDPGVSIPLDELIIGTDGVVVIASNADEFESVYGFEADLIVSSSSVAGSNGDDQALLIDPFGIVIDVFGIIGEDGTGTSHDFEDGKALRMAPIEFASATFNPSQWIIYNKRGGEGTIKQSLNAPDDYSPGIHPQ